MKQIKRPCSVHGLGLVILHGGLVIAILGLSFGCSQSSHETVQVRSSALLSAQFNVTQSFPAGFTQNTVALYTSQSVSLATRVSVSGASGAAPVINVGTGLVDVGADATVGGDAIGGGSMFLG